MLAIPISVGLVFALITPVQLLAERSKQLPVVLNNARQIWSGLEEFQASFGAYPSRDTIAEVKAATKSDWNLTDITANDLLKQLLLTGSVKTEEVFYVEAQGAKLPDDDFSTNENALSAGECGFAYITGQSSAGNGGRPILVAPLIPQTFKFDPQPFNGLAVVLRLDGNVSTHPIDSSGNVIVDGMNLLDSNNSLWAGRGPVVTWSNPLPNPPQQPWHRQHSYAIAAGLVLFIGSFLFYKRQKHQRPAKGS
jgi:hypothetical protein